MSDLQCKEYDRIHLKKALAGLRSPRIHTLGGHADIYPGRAKSFDLHVNQRSTFKRSVLKIITLNTSQTIKMIQEKHPFFGKLV